MKKKNLNTKPSQYMKNDDGVDTAFKKRRGRPPKQSKIELDALDIEHDNEKFTTEDIKDFTRHELKKDKPLTAKEKKLKYYVNTAKLEELIEVYNKTEKIHDDLAIAFYNIANRVAYMPNFINYCVDKETQALTQRGWLSYNEITEKDIILSYDINTKQMVWSKIKSVFRGTHDGKMHSLSVRGMDALVTPNHKFVTLEDGLKSVEFLKAEDHIVLMGKPVISDKKVYTDDFVELMGRAVTEGNYLSMEFILNLTTDQRTLLIQTMLDGDGWTKKEPNGCLTRCYAQKDKNHIDSFVALCTLAGLTTKTVWVENKSEFGKGSYYYNVNIYSDPKIVCLVEHVDFNGGKPKAGGDQRSPDKKGKINRPNIPTIDYNDTIWCPETEYGTFVCRRGKYVYITGNSWREEMIGDGLIKEFTALKNKKYNPKYGRAFSYFTQIVYHSFCNRIKKENKANEVLKDYQNEEYNKLMLDCGINQEANNTSENEFDTGDN